CDVVFTEFIGQDEQGCRGLRVNKRRCCAEAALRDSLLDSLIPISVPCLSHGLSLPAGLVGRFGLRWLRLRFVYRTNGRWSSLRSFSSLRATPRTSSRL